MNVHTPEAKTTEKVMMISADSHAVEPSGLWKDLPKEFRDMVPAERPNNNRPAGASNPIARLEDQARDGLMAEVLFPNLGLELFGVGDAAFQTAAFRIYNDWLADFCKAAPKNHIGITALQAYDIDAAIKEMHRGHDMGLTGMMIWQVPDPKLPFMSSHYDKLWAAVAELNEPIHFHILTGHSYAKNRDESRGYERIRGAVNTKTADTVNTLFEMIFSGAFDKHRNLKMVLVESEVGWIPFVLQQWDYYYKRFGKTMQMPISRLPSEIFNEHVYATIIDDYAGSRALSWWGQNNTMWSSDYPHPNMTYPHSVETVEKHFGGLAPDVRKKLVRDNAIKLYGLKF
jgi:predicted TIM-barrel fold metal-dependent hydrolase